MMYFSSFIHVSFVAKSSHEFFICFSLHCIAVFEKLASFLWRVGIFYLFCICICFCFRFKICIFSSLSAISWVLRSFKVPVLFARFFAVGATQLCTHTLTAARMHAHLCKLQKLASAGKSSSMRVLYLRPSVCVCVRAEECECVGETAACKSKFYHFFFKNKLFARVVVTGRLKKLFNLDDLWMRCVWSAKGNGRGRERKEEKKRHTAMHTK